MYRGYTYSETHGTYYCSSKTSIGCTARIKLTKNGGIQIISEEHSHSPPNYIKTTNGNYIRNTTSYQHERANILLCTEDIHIQKLMAHIIVLVGLRSDVLRNTTSYQHERAKISLCMEDIHIQKLMAHIIVLLKYHLIPTRKGKNLVMYGGYTYSEITGIYYCSSKTSIGCTAQYQLIPTRRGKNLVMYGGYTFSEIHGTYYCSSKTVIGCTARYYLIPTGKGGNLVMWRGYTFSEVYGTLHYCSSKRATMCTARIKLTENGVVPISAVHCHKPPTYLLRSDGSFSMNSYRPQKESTSSGGKIIRTPRPKEYDLIPTQKGNNLIMYQKHTYSETNEYHLIPTPKGKHLLMLNGYTYSANKGKYYCSSKASGCKARIKLDKEGNIKLIEGEHFHSQPKYNMISYLPIKEKISSCGKNIHIQKPTAYFTVLRERAAISVQLVSKLGNKER
ncbi:Modifier of mdg4, partial [Operophtera brumata]